MYVLRGNGFRLTFMQCGNCTEMLTYNNGSHFESHYKNSIEESRENFKWWDPGQIRSTISNRLNWRMWYLEHIVEPKQLFEGLKSEFEIEHYKSFIENHRDISEWFGLIGWHWADEGEKIEFDSENEEVMKVYMLDTAEFQVVYVGSHQRWSQYTRRKRLDIS